MINANTHPVPFQTVSPVCPSRRELIQALCAGSLGMFLASPSVALATVDRSGFIESQSRTIAALISKRRYNMLLSNRYGASCVYYSDNFLSIVAHPGNQIDIPTKILGRVCHLITPEFRQGAIETLKQWSLQGMTMRSFERAPLQQFSFGHGQNHQDAVDLFSREGAPALAFTDGIVLVADAHWQFGDEFSSASMKGGNTVILFSYLKNEFYRYAHLRSVSVKPGDVVSCGARLGTVGHSGKSASQKGHGGHLHFEINRYNPKTQGNQVVLAPMLRRRLLQLL